MLCSFEQLDDAVVVTVHVADDKDVFVRVDFDHGGILSPVAFDFLGTVKVPGRPQKRGLGRGRLVFRCA